MKSHALQFAAPQWLWFTALALALVGALFWVSARARRRQLEQFADPARRAELLASHSAVMRAVKNSLLFLALLLVGIALARPQWGETEERVDRKGDDVVFLIDTSKSMLATDVTPGSNVLIDDGRVKLRVEASDGVRVTLTVLEGGRISNHKGINLPGVRVSAPSMSDKDREDLRFALSLRVDMIALSFVRDPDDILEVHEIMDANGGRLPVIAKIEKPEAVERLEAIVRAFDGLMVARGDLGVEIPLEQVPLVQKRAVRLAREHAKPVIVATQMLESMITHSRPTRAEASDVANAVLDGADAVMLSGETSVGQYPVAAVETMGRIIAAAESQGLKTVAPVNTRPESRGDAIAAAAVRIAEDTHARALVAFTQSGSSARRVASHRTAVPLLAFTSEPAVRSQLALQWGIETFVVPMMHHTDDMVAQVDRALLELGRAERGEFVVIVAGTPPGTVGSTNTLRVHRLGAQ